MIEYVDPVTKESLKLNSDGDLFCPDDEKGKIYKQHSGIFDFVNSSGRLCKERNHYDSVYSNLPVDDLSPESIKKIWKGKYTLGLPVLLDKMGNVKGKRILILGNGTSYREFYFVHLGAHVVYTDLSLQAVMYMKKRFEASSISAFSNGDIEFHAVDAMNLPFSNESFDIVYGFAFVHHIETLEVFLTEVNRCLKIGGMCRFYDDAYSPVWQFMKKGLLRPIQYIVHKKDGISPEDLRATNRGGYREENMIELKNNLGFKDMLFVRHAFFSRICWRGMYKLFGYNKCTMVVAWPLVYLLKKLDMALSKTPWIKKNGIDLIWGFTK